MFGLPGNFRQPATGSILHRWLERRAPHPDSFQCGVQVISGSVPSEGARWRRRLSSTDPLIVDGVVTLFHGPRSTLRLRFDRDQPQEGRRRGVPSSDVALAASEIGTGARVMVAASAAELARFCIVLE